MVPDADRLGSSVTTDGDRRVTPIGRILRRSKLDGSSLWNVLAGEMTLVGPRPETPTWVQLYTPEMTRVLESVPGSPISPRSSFGMRSICSRAPWWTRDNMSR